MMPTINLPKRINNRVPTTDKRKRQEIYQDRRWRLLRQVKMIDNPLCERCEAEGRVKPTEEVHHIVPIDINPDLAFDYDNLKSLCIDCHKLEHKLLTQ